MVDSVNYKDFKGLLLLDNASFIRYSFIPYIFQLVLQFTFYLARLMIIRQMINRQTICYYSTLIKGSTIY